MLRKKKSKRGIIDEDIPKVSVSNARRQVIYGLTGFVLGVLFAINFRPGTAHLLEMIVLIGVVASCTLGGMKLANWVDTKENIYKR